MRKLLILNIIAQIATGTLLASNSATLLNPGYLGKKTTLTFGYSPNVRIGLNLYRMSDINNYSKRVRHNFELNLERAISKVVSFNGAYGLSNFEAKYGIFGDQVYEKNGNATFFGSHTARADVTTSHFMFGMKLYNQQKGAIAPLGNYFHMFYGQNTYSIKQFALFETDFLTTDKFNENAKVQNHDEQFKYSFPFLGMGLGVNRILDDKFLFGIEIMSRFKLKYQVNSEGLEGYNAPNHSNLVNNIAREMNRPSLVAIHFKGGVIF